MHKPDDDPALGYRNLGGFHQRMVEASLSKNIQCAEYCGTLHLHIEDPAPLLFIICLREIEVHLVESIDQGELVLELRSGRNSHSRALEKCRVCGTCDRSAYRGVGDATGIESVVGAPGLAFAIAIGGPTRVHPDGLLGLESG